MENDTLELIDLEQLLEDTCECEAAHRPTTAPYCTETVTHRYQTTCGVDKRICLAASRYVEMCIESRADRLCGGCEKRTADCWTIFPI